jgi:hypothetical protein
MAVRPSLAGGNGGSVCSLAARDDRYYRDGPQSANAGPCSISVCLLSARATTDGFSLPQSQRHNPAAIIAFSPLSQHNQVSKTRILQEKGEFFPLKPLRIVKMALKTGCLPQNRESQDFLKVTV